MLRLGHGSGETTNQSFAHGLGSVPRNVSVFVEVGSGQWRPVSGDGATIKIAWVSATGIRIESGGVDCGAAAAETLSRRLEELRECSGKGCRSAEGS